MKKLRRKYENIMKVNYQTLLGSQHDKGACLQQLKEPAECAVNLIMKKRLSMQHIRKLLRGWLHLQCLMQDGKNGSIAPHHCNPLRFGNSDHSLLQKWSDNWTLHYCLKNSINLLLGPYVWSWRAFFFLCLSFFFQAMLWFFLCIWFLLVFFFAH